MAAESRRCSARFLNISTKTQSYSIICGFFLESLMKIGIAFDRIYQNNQISPESELYSEAYPTTQARHRDAWGLRRGPARVDVPVRRGASLPRAAESFGSDARISLSALKRGFNRLGRLYPSSPQDLRRKIDHSTKKSVVLQQYISQLCCVITTSIRQCSFSYHLFGLVRSIADCKVRTHVCLNLTADIWFWQKTNAESEKPEPKSFELWGSTIQYYLVLSLSWK